jgi:hypothetical protein
MTANQSAQPMPGGHRGFNRKPSARHGWPQRSSSMLPASGASLTASPVRATYISPGQSGAAPWVSTPRRITKPCRGATNRAEPITPDMWTTNQRVEPNRRPASQFRCHRGNLNVHGAFLSALLATVAHPYRSASHDRMSFTLSIALRWIAYLAASVAVLAFVLPVLGFLWLGTVDGSDGVVIGWLVGAMLVAIAAALYRLSKCRFEDRQSALMIVVRPALWVFACAIALVCFYVALLFLL